MQMKSLRLYEEYGARYRVLSADIDHTQIYLASGHDYDRGVEKLNASLNPVSSRDAQLKKALGLKDLLIKVRTVLHIPLLDSSLMKNSPSSVSLATSSCSETFASSPTPLMIRHLTPSSTRSSSYYPKRVTMSTRPRTIPKSWQSWKVSGS